MEAKQFKRDLINWLLLESIACIGLFLICLFTNLNMGVFVSSIILLILILMMIDRPIHRKAKMQAQAKQTRKPKSKK